MKRSKNYYLKRIEYSVEKIRRGDRIDINTLSSDTIKGMKMFFSDYLEYIWLTVGDTAFNKKNYRSSTDYLFEQLSLNS